MKEKQEKIYELLDALDEHSRECIITIFSQVQSVVEVDNVGELIEYVLMGCALMAYNTIEVFEHKYSKREECKAEFLRLFERIFEIQNMKPQKLEKLKNKLQKRLKKEANVH